MVSAFRTLRTRSPHADGDPAIDRNFFELLREGLLHRPDAAAITAAGGEFATLRHRDLDEGSARLAAWLRSQGIAAGDRVAVQCDKCPEAILLYFACLRIGAAYLPLQSGATPAEVRFFLEDARPRLLVCRPDEESRHGEAIAAAAIPLVRTLAAGGGSLRRDGLGCEPDAAIEAVGPDAAAAILYTSGTTGRSKGATLSHRNLAANTRSLLEAWRFEHPPARSASRPPDRLLHALPIDHVHGLFVAIHTLLASGGTLLWQSRFDAAAAVRRLGECTLFMGVPTHYTRLLAEPAFGHAAAAGVRAFISGSAPLLEETFLAFESRCGRRILERYGMTEAGMIASNPYDDESARRPGVVGRALPGVEIRLRREDGRLAADGEVGIVEIRGENVFSGYWGQPQRRDADFTADGFFRSGDLGRIEPDGALRLVGRASDLVISGGLNVYPREVEAVLDTLPGVAESAVVGVPHPDLGEAVVAAVVPIDPERPPPAEAIIAAARERLASFKVPKAIAIVPSLPRNAMGKVQKRRLRESWPPA